MVDQLIDCFSQNLLNNSTRVTHLAVNTIITRRVRRDTAYAQA